MGTGKPKWKGAEQKSFENVSNSLKCVMGTVRVALKMALDSGATCCIISANMAKAHELKTQESDVKVKVATKKTEDVLGVTEPMTIDVQGHSCSGALCNQS